MNIALIGYGKMGKMIESICKERGHKIVSIIDVDNQQDFDSPEFASADVAIEFTSPTAAYGNYLRAFKAGVKVVSGSAGWTNSSGAGIVNPGKWLLTALGSLVQPLFDKGNNVANLKIAQAKQQEALVAFQQKLLDAGAEVNNALTQWQIARKSLKLDHEKVEALNTALRSTQLLMTHGSTNYLEVLTAQQTLLDAQLTEVSDKYDEIEGVISLYQALGGGIQ